MIRFLPLILLISCSQPSNEVISSSDSTITSIQAIMDKQEDAWNNGDLDLFMSPYLKSENLCFVGKSGLNKGWQKTLANYKKSYPSQEHMGALEFKNLEFQKIEDKHFLVIGMWSLCRVNDTLSGHYSLIWENINNNWQIIADHSS